MCSSKYKCGMCGQSIHPQKCCAEGAEFLALERLGQHVGDHLVCRYILEDDVALVDAILDEEISDCNVLGPWAMILSALSKNDG